MRSNKPAEMDKKIGRHIKRARLRAQLDLDDVADALDLTRQAVHFYEKGAVRITAYRLFLIAKITDTPMEWFFGDDLPYVQTTEISVRAPSKVHQHTAVPRSQV